MQYCDLHKQALPKNRIPILSEVRGGLLNREIFCCIKCGERIDYGNGADPSDERIQKRLIMHVWAAHPESIVDGKLVGPA